MRAYSMDLRERIVAACALGEKEGAVAQRFGVCTRTVQRYVARASHNALPPTPIPGRPARVLPAQEAAFVSMIEASRNWTLEQLQEEWQRRSGVFLPRSTLYDHLRRLKGRYKKRVVSPPSVAP
jgi:transposase